MTCRISFLTALLMCLCRSTVSGLPLAAVSQAAVGAEASSSVWPVRASWTIVHAKKKHSEAKSFLSLDAQQGEDPGSVHDQINENPSIHDQIKKMGEDLCKDKPDDPRCKQFAKKPDEEEQQEETPQEPTEAPVTEAPVEVTEAPATQPPAAESTAKPESVDELIDDASAPATKAPPAEVPGETTKNPQKLPSQGVKGKKVRHKDGKTMTSDWHDEYPKSSTTVKPAKSGTWASHSACLLVLLGALTTAL